MKLFVKNSRNYGHPVAKMVGSLFIFQLLCTIGVGQNINSSNKQGPLGTYINTLTGNLFVPREDVYIPAPGFDITIAFFYNSYLQNQNKGFGNGWGFKYDIKYKNDTAGSKTIAYGEGREDNYTTTNGSIFTSPLGFFDTLSQYQTGKFRLASVDGTQLFFDNPVHKKLTRIQDANGNFINFLYTDSLLTSLVNAAGQSISFTYNVLGRLSTVTDAIATPTRSYSYAYDAAGNLVQVTDPLGGINKYTYLVNGTMKTLSDKNNNVVDIIYYSDGSVSEIIGCNKRVSCSYDTASLTTVVTDHLATQNQITKYKYSRYQKQIWLTAISGNCCGFQTSFELDAWGNKTKETDANGQVYQYTYDARGNVLSTTNPLGQTTSYTYTNAFNNVATYTDAKGNVYALNYDAKGNLIQLLAPGNLVYNSTYNPNGQIQTTTNALGNITTFNYDPFGNPLSIHAPNGYHVSFTNDARGNLLSYINPRGNVYQAEIDILSRVKKIITPQNKNIEIAYDAEDNRTMIKNVNNETTKINFDASNRPVKLTDRLNQNQEVGYDGNGNITMVKNAVGDIYKLNYDSRNRLSNIIDPLNNNYSLAYDGNGNITNLSLPNGLAIRATYDALNRLIILADATSVIATITYDKNNNITSITNATGATTTGVYDTFNRLIKITDPLGYTTSYIYNSNSQVIAKTDRNGNTSYYSYDSLNRIKSYTSHIGGMINLAYDAANNIVQAKDENNNATTYAYDNLNRVTNLTYPDGKFLQFGYDAKGNVITKKLVDGSTITYQYDSLDRAVKKIYPNGDTHNYKYDAISRIIEATNNTGTVTIGYDASSRVISESFDGRTTRYSYNTQGRTQTIIYPDSIIIVKTFNTRNKLIDVRKNNAPIVTYQYNNQNQISKSIFGNGIITNYQYDFANRLSTISTAGGLIQNTAFLYDGVRNKTSITRINSNTASEQFNYDNNYRIINYKRGTIGSTPLIENSYTYDILGNRTSTNFNGLFTTYAHNNLNQMLSANSSLQNISITYNNNGNRTFDGLFYKTYDAEGKLLKDSASPTKVQSYLYDAFKRRVQKNVGTMAYKYTYNGLAAIEERDATNNIINRTIFSDFLTPLVNEKGGNPFFYHPNELNSVEAITNNTGGIVEQYQYDVFGKPSIFNASGNPINTSLTGNRFGFTGQQYDTATGSYQFTFRDYSPTLGTFNQSDLIGYADGMGLYQYVGNNPANGIDILGLECPDKQVDAKNALDYSQTALDSYGAFGNVVSLVPRLAPIANALGSLAPQLGTGFIDLSIKGAKFGDAANGKGDLFDASVGLGGGVVQDLGLPILGTLAAQATQATALTAGRTLSLAAAAAETPVLAAAAIITAPVALLDFGLQATSGGERSAGSLLYESTLNAPQNLGNASQAFSNFTFDIFNGAKSDYRNWLQTFGLEDSEQIKFIYNSEKRTQYLKDLLKHRKPKPCPPNDANGSQRPNPKNNPITKPQEILISFDPNEIIGPDGQPTKHWVSVKDRLPYTINCENAAIATAPAKVVRITAPIQPKQDAASFQLGSFGFNNQTFGVPASTAAYTERLDCRDSLGLFVDVTAGYNQLTNQAFWEFQSIDPLTLLPPAAPLKGLLLLQDSSQPLYGHAFVNFSIKPKTNAITLDSIAANAAIIFDTNDTIPTNIALNTIDAVAPTSHLNALPNNSLNPVNLSWAGTDDVGGCGIRFFTLYVSTDGINFSILRSNITRRDTSFVGTEGQRYYFFVLATDSVGNMENARPGEVTSTFIGAPLPISFLYFRGKNENKNHLLTWATSSETNSKIFKIERSLDGLGFTTIGSVRAAGNASTTTLYSFTDYGVDKLKSTYQYYRLQQLDADDKYTYSNIIRLSYNQKDKNPSIVYPNPTHGLITISIGDNKLIGSTALVYDDAGKLLEQIIIAANSQSIYLGKYTNGLYFIKLKNKEILRVIKQ